MRFSPRWVSWIMLCVEIVDYSVLVNGTSVGPFVSGRGLHQSDPLSPYLFIICDVGLSSLIHEAERRNEIKCAMICTSAPIISHLLFVVDCFPYCRACESEVVVIKNILSTYEAASSQAINLQKSEIFCSRNTPDDLKNLIAITLGVCQVLVNILDCLL